jgi:polyisoprenoid-binding protein YceI
VTLGAGVGLVALAVALLPADAGSAGRDRQRYRIDVPRSRFVVNTTTSGVSSMFGHDHKIEVRSYEGTVTMVAGKIDTATLELAVRADGLHAVEEKHEDITGEIDTALHDHVLEVRAFPAITFSGRAVAASRRDDGAFDVKLTGDLRLHGVRRTVTVPLRLTFKDDTMRASGKLSLRQTDYKIVPFSFAGGTVTVANRVTLLFDIVAYREPGPPPPR